MHYTNDPSENPGIIVVAVLAAISIGSGVAFVRGVRLIVSAPFQIRGI